MRDLIFAMIFSLAVIVCRGEDGSGPNVVVVSDVDVYELTVRNGRMDAVKNTRTIHYLARECDDHVVAVQFYGGTRRIDKASAPGARPHYQTYEDEEIFYDGSRICLLDVPLRKGKPAKVVFEVTEEAPEHFCRVALAKRHPTAEAVTEIRIPAALAGRVRVLPYGLTAGMEASETAQPDGSVVYRVTCGQADAWPTDEGHPEMGASMPQLFVTGYFDGVQPLYDFLRGHLPSAEANEDDAVRALAATLRASASTEQALIDSTAAWVRSNIRYYAIEHDDNAYSPAAAASVLARRSGDCKGSANLIKTLLRLNGVRSHLVWVGTRGYSPFGWSEAPAIGVGNHMIAAAETGDTLVYLDGTTRHAFDGYLSPGLRGQEVLIENGDSVRLARVPQSAPYSDRLALRASYAIAGDSLLGHLSLESQGYMRVAISRMLGGLDRARSNVLCQKLLAYGRKNVVPGALTVTDGRGLAALTIAGDLAELGAVKAVGNRLYVDLNPLRDTHLEVIETRGRRSDYQAPPANETTFEYELAVPAGYEVRTLPEACEISDRYFEAHIRYSADGPVIRCQAHVLPKATLIPLAEIEARNSDVARLRQAAGNQIVLQRI